MCQACASFSSPHLTTFAADNVYTNRPTVPKVHFLGFMLRVWLSSSHDDKVTTSVFIFIYQVLYDAKDITFGELKIGMFDRAHVPIFMFNTHRSLYQLCPNCRYIRVNHGFNQVVPTMRWVSAAFVV